MSTQCMIECRLGGQGLGLGQGPRQGEGRGGGEDHDWMDVRNARTQLRGGGGGRYDDRGDTRQGDMLHPHDDRDEIVLRCTMRLPLVNEDNLTSKSLGVQDAGTFTSSTLKNTTPSTSHPPLHTYMRTLTHCILHIIHYIL